MEAYCVPHDSQAWQTGPLNEIIDYPLSGEGRARIHGDGDLGERVCGICPSDVVVLPRRAQGQ